MSPSTRFATIAATLVLAVAGAHNVWLALVPGEDPCVGPDGRLELAVDGSAAYVQEYTGYERTGILQWTEGAFRDVGGTEQKLRFRVVRTEDLAPFFGPPLLFLPITATEGDAREEDTIATASARLPAHFRSSKWARNTFLAAYVYFLGDEPVADPAFAALRRALTHPFSRPRVLTLLTASNEGKPEGSLRGRRESVVRWLTEAGAETARMCRS